MKPLCDMAKQFSTKLSMAKNIIYSTKMDFNILAHFNEGKIDVIGYGKESGEQLTSEEINTFLKANNGDQPMKKQGPNAWVGNNVIAVYHKEGAAWHLAIMAHAQGSK